MNKDVIPSWSVWIIGTVITAILPFLVAFYRFGSGDFTGNYIDYVGLSDTLAFLFSISVNCMILSIDKRKITNIVFKRIVLIFSSIVAFVTGGWYFFSSGNGVDNKNHKLWLFAVWCETPLHLVVSWALPKPARGMHPLDPCPLAGEAGKQQSLFPVTRVIRVAASRAFAA